MTRHAQERPGQGALTNQAGGSIGTQSSPGLDIEWQVSIAHPWMLADVLADDDEAPRLRAEGRFTCPRCQPPNPGRAVDWPRACFVDETFFACEVCGLATVFELRRRVLEDATLLARFLARYPGVAS